MIIPGEALDADPDPAVTYNVAVYQAFFAPSIARVPEFGNATRHTKRKEVAAALFAPLDCVKYTKSVGAAQARNGLGIKVLVVYTVCTGDSNEIVMGPRYRGGLIGRGDTRAIEGEIAASMLV